MIVELYPDESMAITALNRLGNQLYLRLSAESVKESGGTSEVFITAVESLHAQAKESSRVLFDRALRELIRDSDTDYIIGQWQGGSADLPDVENDGAVGSHHHAAAVAQWVIERAQNMAMCKVSTVGDEFAKVQVVFPHAPYALEATLELNTLRQISFYPTAACLDESQRKKGTSYTFTSDLELSGAGGDNWAIFRDFLLYAAEHTDPQGKREKLEDTAMFKGLVGGAL
jgi:hypothetical protein